MWKHLTDLNYSASWRQDTATNTGLLLQECCRSDGHVGLCVCVSDPTFCAFECRRRVISSKRVRTQLAEAQATLEETAHKMIEKLSGPDVQVNTHSADMHATTLMWSKYVCDRGLHQCELRRRSLY